MLLNTEMLKSCHICESHTSQSVLLSCTNLLLCTKQYCIECIKNNFDPQFSLEQIQISSWICFSCQGNCKCIKCVKNPFQEKNENPKKILQFSIPKKESQKNEVIDILDMDEESEEYVTPSFLKAMEKPNLKNYNSRTMKNLQNESNLLFETFKQESMTPYEYSSDLNISNERKSKTIIKCKKERNLIGLKVEKLPPYLDSIMKRKEIFRNFMIRHSKKTYDELVREAAQRVENEKKSQNTIMKTADMPSPVMKAPSVSSNSIIENLVSPLKVPETPSFVPISDPLTPIPTDFKITELLNEKLKEYEMEEDDLSIELI